MRKLCLFMLIAVLMMVTANLFAPPVSKPFNQEVLEYGSYYPDTYDLPFADPDLVSYPEEGSIRFRYYINPEFYLDSEEHGGLGYTLNATMDVYNAFSVRFNVGDIRAYWGNPSWQGGDVITIEIEQPSTGRGVVVQRVLTAGGSPDAYYGIHAVTLVDPPTVLFDSRPDVLDTINTTANLMAGFPDEGVYRANNWTAVGAGDPANSNWNISFSAEGIISDLMVTSKIRRANYFDEEMHFDDIQGPRSFRTYYSTDGGDTWTQHPVVNHLLPLTGEDWMTIEYELPEALYGEENIMLQWRLLAAGGSTIATYPAESWGEIKDVVVTGEGEPPVFYALTIEVEGDGVTAPVAGVHNYSEGTIVDLEAFPADDWEFDFWMIDGVEVYTEIAQVTMDADKTVTAYFVEGIDPNPTVAHSPIPEDGAVDVALDTDIGWTYTSDPEFTDPIGFKLNMWTGDPDGEPFQVYIEGGPGVYSYPGHPFDFQYGTTYHWQVIPTTEPEMPVRAVSQNRTRAAQRQTVARGDAENAPIWSFTTEDEALPPGTYLYTLGDIPSTYNTNPTTASRADDPGLLTITVPDGQRIASISTQYDVLALDGAWMSEQRSFLVCVNNDTPEAQVYAGTGAAEGVFSYDRENIAIANNLTGTVEVELHLFRTWGTNPDLAYNYVVNNTWYLMVEFEDIPDDPIFAVNPDVWDFGLVDVGLTDTKEFVLSNNGAGIITINDGDINIADDADEVFSLEPITYPIVLEGDNTYSVFVHFEPLDGIEYTASLQIEDNLGDRSSLTVTRNSRESRNTVTRDLNVVPLSGEGFVRPAGSTCANPYIVELPLVDYQDNTEMYGNDYLSAWVSPSSNYLNGHDFVAQFDVDAAGYLTASVSGSWTGLFILDQCPDPDDPATRLGFVGTSTGGTITDLLLPEGTYYAIVSTWPAPNFTDFTLNISFEPLPDEPEFAINPESWDFGMVQIGTTVNQTFVISNTGGSPLIITDIEIDGDDVFTVNDVVFPLEIASGSNADIVAQFAPIEVGEFSANMVITDNVVPEGRSIRITRGNTESRDVASREVHHVALAGEGYDATVYPPYYQDFIGAFPPLEWTRFSGILSEDTPMTPVTTMWGHHWFGNVVEGSQNSAHINVYGTRNHWLVTPLIDLSGGEYHVEFDIALTPWTGTAEIDLGPDDYIAFVISTDGGNTWSNANVLIDWQYPDVISNTGERVVIDVSDFEGQVKFGIYAQRPTGFNPDLRFYFTNFEVTEAVEPPPPPANTGGTTIANDLVDEDYDTDIVDDDTGQPMGFNFGYQGANADAGTPIIVNYFNQAPPNTFFGAVRTEPDIFSNYYWEVSAGALTFTAGVVKIDMNHSSVVGVNNLALFDGEQTLANDGLVIFWRPDATSAFIPLVTDYDINAELLEGVIVDDDGHYALGTNNSVHTLPVELASFTASVTANMFVELQWVAETETNMLGYHVYRSDNNVVADARQVTGQPIPATNSSEPQTYYYIDQDVVAGNTYFYWLQTIDLDLTYNFHGPIAITLDEEVDVPEPVFTTALNQNYPNPFNPETTINYSLREDTDYMELKIYNVLGQVVRTLHVGAQSQGEHTVVWNGRDDYNRSVSSGIYFYRMSTPTYNRTFKMMLLK